MFGTKASTVTGVNSCVPDALEAVWPLARLARNKEAMGTAKPACRAVLSSILLLSRSTGEAKRRRRKTLPTAETNKLGFTDGEIDETPFEYINVRLLKIWAVLQKRADPNARSEMTSTP